MTARIVLAEDSDEVRRFARMLLTRKGYDVHDVPDGQAALEAILERAPDLIISDVQMPRLTGLELTARLRERFSKSELPIVLVSVMSEEEDIVKGFEAGANDYIVKPYKTTELLAKVAVMLKEGPYLRREAEPPLPAPEAPPLGDDETRAIPLPSSGATTRYFFDKYEIVGEFGRGGMGTVYRAVKRDDGRPVALKVLAPRLSEDRKSIARFLREIKLLTDIDSPHVVKVYDHGYDGGRYFLAMEAVEGESLDKIGARDGPLDEGPALVVFAQVARALASLHERQLVHRDIKPANIIVSAEKAVKLVDFGLAKRQDDKLHLSKSGYALGTPYYIAPEIIEGGQASPQSDLFALGVTLYESLTGKRPFSGAVPYQIFKLIVAGRYAEPQQLRPELSEAVSNIIARLISKDRRDRAADSAALAEELETLAKEHQG